MLFAEGRENFFRPLIGKYRGQVHNCLSLFYERLYGATADYHRGFNREQVIEILEEAIARSQVFDDENEDENSPGPRTQREQANWILNLLLDHGWLERQIDDATLQASYALSRYGRLFTQPMVEMASGRFRTRHRNTRNTRNALKSFIEKGEVYDLLDAYEYSERIVADFTDVIAELDERRRQLVRAVESQQLVQQASDQFFDFMEKRFMPDLAIRLSADSVEKYRDEISELIETIKRKRKEFKTQAELDLRRVAPELLHEPKHSLLLKVLDDIDGRVHNASAIMLPALRQALNGFTRRADIIMRQLSYAGSGMPDRLHAVMTRLREANAEQQQQALTQMGEALSSLDVGFVDADTLRLQGPRRTREVNSDIEEMLDAGIDLRRELFVQSALDLAFTFNSQAQREYVLEALRNDGVVHSHQLPIYDAKDLLMSAHIIEVGAIQGSEYLFQVSPTLQRVKTDYFELSDGFTIELMKQS